MLYSCCSLKSTFQPLHVSTDTQESVRDTSLPYGALVCLGRALTVRPRAQNSLDTPCLTPPCPIQHTARLQLQTKRANPIKENPSMEVVFSYAYSHRGKKNAKAESTNECRQTKSTPVCTWRQQLDKKKNTVTPFGIVSDSVVRHSTPPFVI